MENINVGLRAKEERFRRWCHFKRGNKSNSLSVLFQDHETASDVSDCDAERGRAVLFQAQGFTLRWIATPLQGLLGNSYSIQGRLFYWVKSEIQIPIARGSRF